MDGINNALTLRLRELAGLIRAAGDLGHGGERPAHHLRAHRQGGGAEQERR